MMSLASIDFRDACVGRDLSDPLRGLRDRFAIPDGVIYLDGNSLGPMPCAAASVLNRTIEQEWGHDLIRSWNSAGWFDMPVRLGDRLGCLLGAAPGQTVVCDTTSINLFKAIHATFGLRPDRDVVIAEDASFPTDLYIIEGAMNSADRPMQRRLVGTDGPSVEALLDQRVAVSCSRMSTIAPVSCSTSKPSPNGFTTPARWWCGMSVIPQAWSNSHSTPMPSISRSDAPTNISMAVRDRRRSSTSQKLIRRRPGIPCRAGGDMRRRLPSIVILRPMPASSAFFAVRQPIISLRGVDVALDALEGVELTALRQKSLALTELFIARVAALLPEMDIVTPHEPTLRGSQVSVAFEKGYAVVQAMIERGVIGDFRAPDIMRFGFAPLYLRFQDVWDAADILADCVRAEVWRDPRFNRQLAVT